MHLPPAASWMVGQSQGQRHLLAALVLLGALATLFFCYSQSWGASSLLVLLVLAGCSVAAVAGFGRSAQGLLRWDGERWHWPDPAGRAVADVVCVLDLQRLMLLRLDFDRRPCLWLWLQSPEMDGRWLAMRRAVVASPQAKTRAMQSSLPG